jgi:hypothetical protein
MHFIQENGQTLDLVDDYDRISRFQLLGEPAGIPAKGQKDSGVQEIINLYPFESMADKRCFARLPRSEKETRPFSEQTMEIEQTRNPYLGVFLICRHSRHLSCQMTTTMSSVILPSTAISSGSLG